MKNNILLKTERLLLKPVDKNDASDIFEYRSKSEINKYQGWIPNTIEDVYTFLNRISKKVNLTNTWFQFVILQTESNQIIGDVGIHFLADCNEQVEFGITIAENHQNRGFAFEATLRVFEYLFESLNKHRIIASVDPRNINCIKLLEKLKMRQEAHFVQSLFLNNEWVDDIVYASLKDDYRKLKK